jgi:hypothetical protein
MSLEQWRRNAWLQPSDSTLPEISQLLRVADREISDAEAKGLSPDGQFMHAYDAALLLCKTALRAAGYCVPKGQGHHKKTIESLKLTLGKPWDETSDYLDLCSRQRGQALYEQVGVVSEKDANDLPAESRRLRTGVLAWLKTHHAELVPPNA